MQGWGLVVLNVGDYGPTFSNHNGSSSIDLSIATPVLASAVRRWRADFATASVHALLSFDVIELSGSSSSIDGARFQTRRARWGAFRSELSHWMVDYILADDVPQTVDEHLQSLSEPLLAAACNTLKLSAPRGQTNRAWWTEEIREQKKRLAVAARRKRAAAAGSARSTALATWKEEKKIYKRMIRRSKRETWKRFVVESISVDPWSLPYRVVREKLRPDQALASFRTGNSYASGIDEAAEPFSQSTMRPRTPRRQQL
ncbi:hypothetical protein GE061_013250 [Apolygus lucorum]|uniref:Endonuclease/exonuclease/phosphatase domain-containing protein n=1 Tax=Apolygus lucorum TaxID=248454 RepID=A0A8S9XPI7_APOLU|nr:hypothetical protein GE061_013250 [Apolygus lucorum]